MTTHPSRALVRSTAVAVALGVTLTFGGPVVAAAAAGADATETDPGADPAATRRSALELAQGRLDDARRLATDAAEKLAAAETQRGTISAEITASEAEIPRLRARADELRATIRSRAARLYIRSATPALDAVVNTTNVVDAARAAHLTATIGDHEEHVAVELQDTARTLEVREAELRDQRQGLDRAIASITPLRDALDQRLERAATVYDKVRVALAEHTDRKDVATGAAVCPVRGFVVFTDDFEEPRDDGALHQGIDMPAREGTPIVATTDGIYLRDESPAGGHGARVLGNDSVTYSYAHFSRYEGDDRRAVVAGDVIGYVGTTGVSTGPHLHFEVHPNGGPAVDGFPLLLTLCADESAPSKK